ncbi:polysaccharide deacetylase family protein [Phytohabitans flavus]|uniref:Polysaccharide deacetylase familiy protein n=1 Tax=Phytohabitans flavus TaxID=1076124 RepID=A0A6F8XWX0_9ACTN|nr:polysaccharide deacetylase family protein [Phytohabitans flavus]BCB78231.1 polysaccharide deacetylase familiy protein [Phytohabitans flavus]
MIGVSGRIGAARLAAAAGLAAVAHCAPALTALTRLRISLFPRLAGLGDPDHVALTFDDGPHPASTPHFLEALGTRGVRATFFLLGSMLERRPELGRDLVAAGHEVAVHGWAHRNLLLERPAATYYELARAQTLIAETTGTRPRFFRPPHGILSLPALLAARKLELTPVLWTRWGKEWTRSATPGSVCDTLTVGLTGGATVLLHDSGCTFVSGSWRFGLAALPRLLDHCAERGLQVGPLGEHWRGVASCS